MLSIINLKSFTKVLTLFCLLVFIYIVVPNTSTVIKDVLKYIIIIYTIILLILYNQVLSLTKNSFAGKLNKSIASDTFSNINFSKKIKDDYSKKGFNGKFIILNY